MLQTGVWDQVDCVVCLETSKRGGKKRVVLRRTCPLVLVLNVWFVRHMPLSQPLFSPNAHL
eukprot:1662628-Amphidinium_carterae.1